MSTLASLLGTDPLLDTASNGGDWWWQVLAFVIVKVLIINLPVSIDISD